MTEAANAILQLKSLRPHFEKEIEKDLERIFSVEGLPEDLKDGRRKAGLAV